MLTLDKDQLLTTDTAPKPAATAPDLCVFDALTSPSRAKPNLLTRIGSNLHDAFDQTIRPRVGGALASAIGALSFGSGGEVRGQYFQDISQSVPAQTYGSNFAGVYTGNTLANGGPGGTLGLTLTSALGLKQAKNSPLAADRPIR